MHKQVRVKPTASPPDLERLLRVIKDAKINIAAAGGSDLELDGEFAFTVDHSSDSDPDKAIDDAMEVLRRARYDPYPVDVTECWLEDRAGTLWECVRDVGEANLKAGKVIKDIAIGGPGSDGRIPVQIYSIEVRTPITRIAPAGEESA